LIIITTGEFRQAETHTRVCDSSSDLFPSLSSTTYVTTIIITYRILLDDIIKEEKKKKTKKNRKEKAEENDEDVQPADPLLFSTLILITELIRLRFLLARI
jgi:hypothetical protein